VATVDQQTVFSASVDHRTESVMMAGGFDFEDTYLNLDFESLAAVCPVLSPPSLEDVADILLMDNTLDSLIPGLTSPMDMISQADDSFSMLDQFNLDDTFTSEDRWPI
jgi:hypothetical protein